MEVTGYDQNAQLEGEVGKVGGMSGGNAHYKAKGNAMSGGRRRRTGKKTKSYRKTKNMSKSKQRTQRSRRQRQRRH
jgi:hypothetical protein